MADIDDDSDTDFWGDAPADPPAVVDIAPRETPKPPRGLRARGKRLFCDVAEQYELAEHELAILTEAARTLDLVEQLEAVIRDEGAVIDSPQGRKSHPAVVEIRQQRIILARLVAALRIPLSEEQEQGRLPQRRTGVRDIKGA